MTPIERRFKEAADGALAALSPEQRAELLVLDQLDPDVGPGMKAEFLADHPDVLGLTWAGAQVAIVSRDWLLTGELPAEWPPSWYQPDETP